MEQDHELQDAIRMAVEALERVRSHHQMRMEEAENSIAALIGQDSQRLRRTKEFENVGLTDAAEIWLKEMGEPRRTPEIAAALFNRGIQTLSKAKNFRGTVFSALDQDKKRFKRKDSQWWLVEWEGKDGK